MTLQPRALVGRVLSLRDGDDCAHDAVVLRGDRVAAVADRREAAAATGGGELLDFGARAILPAFVDPHAHVEAACTTHATTVDCRAPGCPDVAAVCDALARRVASDDGDGWIVGQANLFFDQKLADGRLPTRVDLDRVSRERPIVVRAGGHISCLNSAALERSGVARYAGRSGMMGGAVVELDAAGEPSGIVGELDKALDLPVLDRDGLREALRVGVRDLFLRHGVVSLGEISDTIPGLELMDELIGAREIAGSLSAYLWAPGTMTAEQALAWPDHLRVGRGGDRFEVRGLKVFADGGYSSQNAATRTPYLEEFAHPGSPCGRVDRHRGELGELIRRTRAAGMQLAVHANGERAQDEIVAAALAAGGAGEGPPVRIEHAGNVLTDYAAAARWPEAGVLPVPQPVFIYNFGQFLPVYLGEPLRRGRFPFRRLLADGHRISGSSDVYLGSEADQTNPMTGVWCCVAREGFHGEQLEPDERIPVLDALRMHTLYAAEALGQGDVRGSLEPGKRADVVVLERDPREVPEADVRGVRVDYVLVDGRIAYERPGARPPERIDAG